MIPGGNDQLYEEAGEKTACFHGVLLRLYSISDNLQKLKFVKTILTLKYLRRLLGMSNFSGLT